MLQCTDNFRSVNCVNLHCFASTSTDASIVKIKFSNFYHEPFHAIFCGFFVLPGVAFSNSLMTSFSFTNLVAFID